MRMKVNVWTKTMNHKGNQIKQHTFCQHTRKDTDDTDISSRTTAWPKPKREEKQPIRWKLNNKTDRWNDEFGVVWNRQHFCFNTATVSFWWKLSAVWNNIVYVYIADIFHAFCPYCFLQATTKQGDWKETTTNVSIYAIIKFSLLNHNWRYMIFAFVRKARYVLLIFLRKVLA